MQLKINIANLLKRAMDAQIQGQYGTCRQLYTKGLGALANVTDKDPYLLAREEDMRQGCASWKNTCSSTARRSCKTSRTKRRTNWTSCSNPRRNGDHVTSTGFHTGAHGPICLPTAHGNACRHGAQDSPWWITSATAPPPCRNIWAESGAGRPRSLAGGGMIGGRPHRHLSLAPACLLGSR